MRRLLRSFHPLARELDSRIAPHWALRRAAVSNRRKYCYFRIPKCANSTVLKSLTYYDPDLETIEEDLLGSQKASQFEKLLSAEALSLSTFQRRYYCFTFVRNPYTRLLSAYLDKMAARPDQSAKYRRMAAEAALADPADEASAFERFVGWLETGGLWQNPHWAPQVAILPVRVSRLDFVGRVENLDRDLATVIDAIFGSGTFVAPQTREYHRRGAGSKVRAYYADALAERVYRLYKEDFEAFGYAAELL